LAIKELRPHLRSDDFLDQIKLQQREGYTLAYFENEDGIQAACGFRIATFLAWGKVFYIDDLITIEAARGQGLGGMLLTWMISQARSHNCNAVHLDTGHHRHDAHRLYLSHGFKISSHHLSLEI
jgi:GNAT superfamily N-acetyltransferase